MQTFQWKFLCDSSDITYFRRRIGDEGSQEIFNASVALHGESAKEGDVVIDTTVQEKNITFPTDSKLHIKIILKCRGIAKKESIILRRSFTQELPKLLRTIFNLTKWMRLAALCLFYALMEVLGFKRLEEAFGRNDSCLFLALLSIDYLF